MSKEIDENVKEVKKEVIIDTDYVEEVNDIKEDIIIDKKIVSKNKKKNTRKKTMNNQVNLGFFVCLVVVLSVISGFLGAYFVLSSNSSNYVDNGGGIVTSNAVLNETNSISNAVEKVYDAVVVVEVYSKDKLVSTGTGFVYKKSDDKVYLMTNNHVIDTEGDGDVKVLFTDGLKLDAKVVGSDIYSDIAVLSVKNDSKIVSAVMGDSDKSSVGDTVFAIGSPQGSDYAGTVTKGIVSGKNRIVEVALSNSSSIDYYMEVLQTDAAINPGNSGGPLCNISGEVIGITNMKLVDDTVEAMGFAIPIEDALKVAEVLEKEGKVIRPYVGIEMLDLSNPYSLWQAGILIPEGVDEGVVVYNVVNDSPADAAGLKKGDIIIKLGKREISGLADFRYELYKYNPKDEVEVIFVRDGEENTTTITLGNGE